MSNPEQTSMAQNNQIPEKNVSPSKNVEGSVTSLIISTKNLLQKLTAWTRGQESQKSISDAYVQLGNDFQIVVKQFRQAGIDMSDMRNVPKELRGILEKALRETPSNEALDKYWPSIKDIIETLLTKIKVKRGLLKHAEDRKKQKTVAHGKELGATVSSSSLTSPSTEKILESIPVVPESTEIPQKFQQTFQDPPPQNFRRRSSSRVLLSPEDFKTADEKTVPDSNSSISQEPSSTLSSEDTEAFAKLKNGDQIQRKASKRFSAYHIAKLTNSTNNSSSHPLPSASGKLEETTKNVKENAEGDVGGNNNAAKESREATVEIPPHESKTTTLTVPTIKNQEMQRIASMDHKLIIIFLKYKDQVKKCNTTFPISSRSALILLFAEKFSMNFDSTCQIYLKDPKYPHVSYEFEESEIELLNDGFVIEFVENSDKSGNTSADDSQGSAAVDITKGASEEWLKTLEDKLVAKNMDLFNNMKTLLQESLASVHIAATNERSTSNLPVAPLDFGIVDSGSADSAKGKEKLVIIEDLKRDIRVLRQIQTENKSRIETSVATVVSQLAKLDPAKLFSGGKAATDGGSKMGEDRKYLETSQSKLAVLSDDLVADVDELQDTIELLRKDVALRGSQPSERKLEEVEKELKMAVKQLEEMDRFVKTERPFWKNIWEQELEEVCEEQQFLNLQEDLCFDLQEDLKICEETFGLVKKCCEEQAKKKLISAKTDANSPADVCSKVILPLAKPGTFNEVRKAVLMNIDLLEPDHDGRIEAIKKSEKMRVKEKELLLEDKFDKELGEFVGSGQLNKSGGIAELERARMDKDAENLKNMMMK